jgi:microcystin-dependent protein
MASEIVDDLNVTTIEINDESGINLSGYNSRIKHSGEGVFTLTSTSSLDEAISIYLANGGLDVNAHKTIDFKAYDESSEAITLQAYQGGIGITALGNIDIFSADDSITLETQGGEILLLATDDISLLTENSVVINSSLEDCDAINIIASSGGLNTYAHNIFVSCGTAPFFPLNKEKTDLSNHLKNLLIKSTPLSQNLIENQINKVKPNADVDELQPKALLCPVGYYSQFSDNLISIVTERANAQLSNIMPGIILVSNQSATVIRAVGTSGLPDQAGYVNSDLILYTDGCLKMDSEGVSGILIGTEFTIPIEIGTTENLTTINGDLTVEGSLIVNGPTVQHNVTIFDSEDPLFYLNKGVTGTNTMSIGFIGERGNQQNVGWFWNESSDEFVAVGITANGDEPSNLITPIDNYKPIHCGGLIVETDTSNVTPTVCNVNVNGNITLQTSSNSSSSITVTSSAGGIDVNTVSGTDITNTGNTTALSVNQQGSADIVNFQDNGTSALIVKDGGTVGINTASPSSTYKLDVNGKSNVSDGVYQAGFLLVPPGAIMPYAASTAPGGWLICDGSAVSRTTYSALFALVGSQYGNGDGINTFNLPNMNGRMIVGYNSADGNFDSLGEAGGSKTATLTTNELPAHTHTGTTSTDGLHNHDITDPGHRHTITTINDDFNNSGASPPGFSADSAGTRTWDIMSTNQTGITINNGGSHSHTFTTASTGSGNAFAIMNPYITLNYIIKY